MAYGARLESVLGESPRGFESPILREIWSAPPSNPKRPPELLQKCLCGAYGQFLDSVESIASLNVRK